MIICDLCTRYARDGQCKLGLKTPKRMACREFNPGIERFCSKLEDFVSPGQVIEMSTYFGIKGPEMKKVKLMAAREVSFRSLTFAVEAGER